MSLSLIVLLTSSKVVLTKNQNPTLPHCLEYHSVTLGGSLLKMFSKLGLKTIGLLQFLGYSFSWRAFFILTNLKHDPTLKVHFKTRLFETDNKRLNITFFYDNKLHE